MMPLVNCRSPDVGRLADSNQRHKAAVRTAVDADLFGIDETRGFQEINSGDFIFEVAAAQVLKVSLLEVEAIARGATRVGSDADVSA